MKYTISVLLVTACLFAACTGKEHPVDLVSGKKEKNNNTHVFATVIPRPLAGDVRLPGQLRPYEEVSIYSKVNGFVQHIYADRGSMVHKGQILARLEAPEMQAQVQTANSKYAQMTEAAAAGRERYRRLKEAATEPGAVSQLDLDNALARMKADEAAMQSEKANVSSANSINSYLTITAPFDGVIVQRNVSEGALVGSGKTGDQPLFILQETSQLRLEVMIPEAYVDKVDLGHAVQFSLTAAPGKTFTGKISRTANALGSMRSEAVEIDVPNVNQTLKAGMYAEVSIPLRSASASLVVPSSAVIRSTEHMYVITDQQGKAHLEDVKEGMKSGDSTEVFGHLPEGTKVLLHATDEIREGDPL